MIQSVGLVHKAAYSHLRCGLVRPINGIYIHSTQKVDATRIFRICRTLYCMTLIVNVSYVS